MASPVLRCGRWKYGIAGVLRSSEELAASRGGGYGGGLCWLAGLVRRVELAAAVGGSVGWGGRCRRSLMAHRACPALRLPLPSSLAFLSRRPRARRGRWLRDPT